MRGGEGVVLPSVVEVLALFRGDIKLLTSVRGNRCTIVHHLPLSRTKL